ncbi:predicted protein, partial [Nematostella vectensis]
LPGKLNEVDPTTGEVPLHIALSEKLDSIARTLVGHGCDVDMVDSSGNCLLHKAISHGDEFSSTFLIKNGARVSAANHAEKVTPLHLTASYRLNLELRDNQGRVPLWLALSCDSFDSMDEESLAAKLVKHGASADAVNTVTGAYTLEPQYN